VKWLCSKIATPQSWVKRTATQCSAIRNSCSKIFIQRHRYIGDSSVIQYQTYCSPYDIADNRQSNVSVQQQQEICWQLTVWHAAWPLSGLLCLKLPINPVLLSKIWLFWRSHAKKATRRLRSVQTRCCFFTCKLQFSNALVNGKYYFWYCNHPAINHEPRSTFAVRSVALSDSRWHSTV